MHYLTFLDYDAGIESGERIVKENCEKNKEKSSNCENLIPSAEMLSESSERLMQLEAKFDISRLCVRTYYFAPFLIPVSY